MHRLSLAYNDDVEVVTVSAFSDDYSDNYYIFYYGHGNTEIVSKEEAKFVESQKFGSEFGIGVSSRPNGLEVAPSIKMKFENYGSPILGDKLEAMHITWRD